jgi:hypothetical protein
MSDCGHLQGKISRLGTRDKYWANGLAMGKSPSRSIKAKDSSGERWLLRTIGVLCLVAATAGDHFCPAWGRTILASTFIFIGLPFVLRRYWTRWWFWGTIVSVLIVHMLLLQQIRALLNSQNIFGFFLLAASEAMIVAAILSLPISLSSDRNSSQRGP